MLEKVKEIALIVLGALIVGYFMSYLIGFVLDFLPIVVGILTVLIPIYGVVRMKFKEKKYFIGLKNALLSIKKLNFGWVFYLVLGIALYFIHQEVAFMVAKASLVGAGGLLLTYVVWEATRLVVKKSKKKKIPSFSEALKNAW